MKKAVLTAVLLAVWNSPLPAQILPTNVSVGVAPILYPGDPIDIQVRYTSMSPPRLYFGSTYQADYILDNFQWSHGMYFAQVLTSAMTPHTWPFRHNQNRHHVAIGRHSLQGYVVGYGYSPVIYFDVVPRPGDINADESVDMVDYGKIIAAWLSGPGDAHWDAACDLVQDGDNQINTADLCVLLENWLK